MIRALIQPGQLHAGELGLGLGQLGDAGSTNEGQWRPHDKPLEIGLLLLLDELYGKTGGKMSDDAADAHPDGERHSDWGLQGSRHRDTAGRHIDDEAFVDGSVGQGDRRMRICRDDAHPSFPQFGNAGILQLLFQPVEFVRKPLTRSVAHIKFEQETSPLGVADVAVQIAEFTEIGREAVADPADDGDVHGHPVR